MTINQGFIPRITCCKNADMVQEAPVGDAFSPDRDITVRLWSTAMIKLRAGEQCEGQLNTSYAVAVLLYGAGTLLRDQMAARLKQDQVYVAKPGSTLQLIADEGEELAVAVLRWSFYHEPLHASRQLQEVEDADWLPDKIELEPSGAIAERCRNIIEHHRDIDPLLRWHAQVEMQELLLGVAQAIRQLEQPISTGSLEHARTYIEQHFHEELTTDHLARIAELSPKYFVDSFKKEYGLSAITYITELRMARAKQLMLRSDKLLRDIAHEVGYEDEFYFSRKFKKMHGSSPSQFMRRRRCRKIAIYGCHTIIGYVLPLHIIPFAAPMHPKWTGYYMERIGVDIPYHLHVYHGTDYQPDNIEQLIRIRPDVIVCRSTLKRTVKERLGALAQVIELPEFKNNSWRCGLMALAETLGETAEAERWLQAYDRKVKKCRSSLSSCRQGATIVCLRMHKRELFLYTNQGIEDVVYGDLGMVKPDALRSYDVEQPITLQQLEKLDCDLALLLVRQETETLEHWSRLQRSSEWLSLDLVRKERVLQVSSSPWREYSPEAMLRMLEQATALLSGKCPC
ncbi:helix-turn-helix domain-containing protein [Paenibacillus aquistagni]|uniref:helix-turn-helix domain-containing protein n=1 Tax=Paenibacillus aquistagni TaxID=1852522 RepID=UPI001483B3F8|nr:helix-turn-helix domain-containing protein [Paenibacillus aquistagni]